MPYKKVIIVDEKDIGFVKKRNYKGLEIFEVPLNKPITFKLDVIKASNEEATKKNVYWIAQAHHKYGTREFLHFKNVPKDQKEFHKHLNNINIGTKYYYKYLKTADGKDFLLDKYNNQIKNPDYHRYTLKDTGYIGTKYIATNPYKSNTERREGLFFGNLTYTTRI